MTNENYKIWVMEEMMLGFRIQTLWLKYADRIAISDLVKNLEVRHVLFL
jgi:hypothetical protein